MQIVSVVWVIFFVHGCWWTTYWYGCIVVGWEYETIFNAQYFIINTKITALCSCNRLAVLTCVYLHTLVAKGYDRHTHTYALTHTHPWSRAQHTYISGYFSLKDLQEHLHYIHAQVVCWRVSWCRHTYTPPFSHLIACTNTHTPCGTVLFHTDGSISHIYACSITCNLCTCFISVKWIFLVDNHIAGCTVRHLCMNHHFLMLIIGS